MKTVTVELSDEQHARLLNLALALDVSPGELMVTEAFTDFDSAAAPGLWDYWRENEFQNYIVERRAFRKGSYELKEPFDLERGLHWGDFPVEYYLAAKRGIRIPPPPAQIFCPPADLLEKALREDMAREGAKS